MTTRLVNLVPDALGWEVTFEARHEVAVEPPAGTPGIPLVFVPVPDAKTVPNRVHLDLASPSAEAQAALVARLLDLGATRSTSARAACPDGPGRPRGQRAVRACSPPAERAQGEPVRFH